VDNSIPYNAFERSGVQTSTIKPIIGDYSGSSSVPTCLIFGYDLKNYTVGYINKLSQDSHGETEEIHEQLLARMRTLPRIELVPQEYNSTALPLREPIE
jgi:hypothetical protein